ncbi:MAG: hypothetical protein Q9219_003533 [cf. Caloplaca sp. 3 TL-2023]
MESANVRKSTQLNHQKDQKTTRSLRNQEPEDGGSSRGHVRPSILTRIARGSLNILPLAPWGRRSAVTPGPEPQLNEDSQYTMPQTVPKDERVKVVVEHICMFTHSKNRLPVLSYEDLLSPEKEPWMHFGMMNVERSTRNILKRLVQSHTTQPADPRTKVGLLEYLVLIILKDTLMIVRNIDLTLTQMNDNLLNDELLQQSINYWRRILNRFETELRRMETSIPNFVRYVLDGDPTSNHPTSGEYLTKYILQTQKVQERIRITYASLMTAMSLVESKRGISEAESVTKLTELAFFFIPLTFSASLFSMQVKELDASDTSVGVFFGVALTVTICSYALRLIIRSSTFLGLWRRWQNDVRKTAKVRPGTPIATTTVLRWLWHRMRPMMYPIYVMVPTAGLLAGLWTRSLQEDIKVGVTIGLAMVALALAIFMVLLRWDMSREWARIFAR